MERDWCSYAWYVDTLMRNRDEFTVVNRSRAFPQVEAVEDVRHILTPRFFPPLAFSWRFSNPVAPDEKLEKTAVRQLKTKKSAAKSLGPNNPRARQLSCQDPLASIKSTLVIADTCTAPYFRLHLFARYISCTFRSAKPSKGTVYAFTWFLQTALRQSGMFVQIHITSLAPLFYRCTNPLFPVSSYSISNLQVGR